MVVQLTSWLLPNHYLPWSTFYQDLLSGSALALLFMVWSITAVNLKAPQIALLTLIVALLPLLQWWAGIIPLGGDAIMASLYLFGFSVAITMGYNLAHSDYDIPHALSVIFIIGGLASTALSLYQWLQLSGLGIYAADLGPNAWPYGNLAQPNNLATLLICALLSSTFLWEKNRISALTASLIAIVLIFGIALTQSRTPWVVALALAIWWFWKKKALAIKLQGSTLFACLGFYAAVFLSLPLLTETLFLHQPTNQITTSLGVRATIWQQLLDAAWNGPWWGYGWKQVSAAQISFSLDYPISQLVQHSHNLFIELLVSNGPWLGGLLVILISGWVIFKAWRVASLDNWFSMAIIGTMLTHAMLEYPLHYAYFLIPFGLLTGHIEGTCSISIPRFFCLPRWLAGCAAISSTLMLVLIAREYLIIEDDFRLLRFESRNIGTLRATQPAPDVVILSQLREFIAFARTKAKKNMSEEEINKMEVVAHRFAFPSSMFRYALALGLNNQPTIAQLELQRLRKLHGEEVYQEAIDNWESLYNRYPELKIYTTKNSDRLSTSSKSGAY